MTVGEVESGGIGAIGPEDEAAPPAKPDEKPRQRRPSPSRNPRLRLKAGLAYATHATCPTLEQLQRFAEFRGISVRTLERWSAEDGWNEERTAFLQATMREARGRLQNEIATDQIDAVRRLKEVEEMAFTKLHDDDLKPKSWEGVLGTLAQVTSKRLALQLEIAKHLEAPAKATLQLTQPVSQALEAGDAAEGSAPLAALSSGPSLQPGQWTEEQAAVVADALMAYERKKTHGDALPTLTESKPDAIISMDDDRPGLLDDEPKPAVTVETEAEDDDELRDLDR